MDLNIGIIQSDILWESVDENLVLYEKKIEALASEKSDVIVMPEMFSTGFSMNSSAISQKMTGEIIAWIKNQAIQNNVAIIAGVAIEENGNYYNRLIWCNENGNTIAYDKRHLFRIAGEHKYYKQGDGKIIIEYKDWKICPFICYDLRFPVWSRNVINTNHLMEYAYDCAIYIANWPESRQMHWSTLLKARAIENQTFVVGVNRVGKDNKEFTYSGNSSVYKPDGTELFVAEPHAQIEKNILLEKNELTNYRRKFPFILDADL